MTSSNTDAKPSVRSKRVSFAIAAAAIVAIGGVSLAHFGTGGLKNKVMRTFIPEYGLTKPLVQWFPRPVNGEHDVRGVKTLALRIHIRNGKDPINHLDVKTMQNASVTFGPSAGGENIPLNIKANDDRLMLLKLPEALKPGVEYTLTVKGLKTLAGASLPVFTEKFTTAHLPDPSIQFHKVALPTAEGVGFTSVVFGPGHKLYAGTDEGRIFIYNVLPDGTLSEPEKITSLQTANNAQRLITGFCFDPASTEANPIIWVSHGFRAFHDSPDFSGKITRMSGPHLENVQDVVINLPRSFNDHLNNQPSIGPDGALYWPQGASNAFGAPDETWGFRKEHLLTATLLRLDLTKVTPGQPIDALTTDVGGKFDPRAPGVPLTVYAVGIRNAYDMVWTSKGQLFVPTNGSSAGGNSPDGPDVAGLKDIQEDENDWLFRVTPGADQNHPNYYGHPNPLWNHYILNGGNMGGQTSAETPEYPIGTKPDPMWIPAAYDFGPHISANGVIEYMSDTFDGKLKNHLLVCRYNEGSDLIDLTLNDKGDVIATQVGVPGFTNLSAPLDLVEDRTNGNIYLAEYGAQCITLIKPNKK